jgi:parvulin-like peptidyl-prolyl isomerase
VGGMSPGLDKMERRIMFRRFVLLITAALPIALAADVQVVEEIAAKVNGDIITRGELEQKRKEIEQYFKGQGLTGAKLAEAVKKQAADGLRDEIDTLLLVQKGKDLNINVDPEVNRRMAELQVQSKITDPDKFHNWVRDNTGMSFEDFKDRTKKEMLTQRVIGNEVGSRMAVPEADMRKYYEEHKNEYVRKEQVFLSQILISTEGKTPEQAAAAEKKAKDLAARARKGDKFSDLARENSDDVETAKSGGQLPPFGRGMMLKQIEDVVFKEKKGYISDPIKIPQGFIILKIEERYEAGQASFEEVRNEVQDAILRPRMEPKVRELLTKLRQDAFLEIKEGYIDSGAAPAKDTRWHEVAELKPETTTKEEVAARRKRKILWLVPHGYWKQGEGTEAGAAEGAEKGEAAPTEEKKAEQPAAAQTAATPVKK